MTENDFSSPWQVGLPGLPPAPTAALPVQSATPAATPAAAPAAPPAAPAASPFPRSDAAAAPVATPAPAAARAVGLVKVYGDAATGVRALDGVSVDFAAGRFTAIMGPSGSGKSTLLHCVAGLDTPTAGQVWLGDTELSRLSDEQLTRLRRDRVGFVFQSFNLLPTLTARQNVLLPLDLAGRKPDAGWLDHLVGVLGLGDRMHHRPAELSGGQQQRVAIARALASRPLLVVADEPTGNLDSRSGAEVLSLLRASVREMGQTVVMVTHDPVAASYADSVLLLADGRLHGRIDAPTPQSVAAALAGAETGRAG